MLFSMSKPRFWCVFIQRRFENVHSIGDKVSRSFKRNAILILDDPLQLNKIKVVVEIVFLFSFNSGHVVFVLITIWKLDFLYETGNLINF